ncbi:MAG TPA: glycosyltransferase family 2 protein [Allosphingosinicella sp.]|nr:glycosyltransferase family 2 protein [Allosphingosinicella sp.]
MSKVPRLSICITTLNRARFIGETLDSIVPQLTPDVEVVIVDGGSTDGTGDVVRPYLERTPQIRYFNTGTGGPVVPNAGYYADCDYNIEQARGEHIWLFSDDDLLVPHAVETVLRELGDGDPDLLIVDSEVRDLAVDRLFEPTRLPIRERRDYRPEDRDAFMADAGNTLTFLGVVIIRRSCWLTRDSKAYYGSYFMHVGVIFQQPPLPHARVLPQALVQIRMGNAMWTHRSFEIWMATWPKLIWGFEGYSDAAKAAVVPREPWRAFLQILGYRAYGSFTRSDYRAHVAPRAGLLERLRAQLVLALPGPLAHILVMTMVAVSRSRHGSVAYNLLVASRNSNPVSRAIGRLIGHSLPARTPAS